MKNDRKRTFMMITIPVLVLFFVFNTLPLIKGFMYSFTNFKGYGSYDWVGLRNYIDLFQDARVGKSYLFTFKFALVGTIIVNVLSLIMALALNSRIKFKRCAPRDLLYSEYPGRIGYWLHFRIYFYIYPSCSRKSGRHWLLKQQLAFQHEVGMVCNRGSSSMAVHCYEYHYLYFRSADSSGRCIRSRFH